MEGQSEHVHVACTFLARLASDLYAQSVLIDRISASELSRKPIKSALLVGCEDSTYCIVPPPSPLHTHTEIAMLLLLLQDLKTTSPSPHPPFISLSSLPVLQPKLPSAAEGRGGGGGGG